MSDDERLYLTSPIEPDDVACDFSCGVHPLDDYFKRHALRNHLAGISRAFVLRRATGAVGAERPRGAPRVLGFYTLSMANVASTDVAAILAMRLPKYPMPVALVGRLATDARERGQRIGESLLLDALRRIVNAASALGCLGAIVDAKDEGAEAFYAKYDFVAITVDGWPRRMFLPLETARAALAEP